MLNNKIALIWCHVLESTTLVLYLKLFSYVTCLPCHRKVLRPDIVWSLCWQLSTNHFVPVSANENILQRFSFDFCTLKKKVLIKKLPGVSVFIGVGGGDVLFSVPEVLSG